MVGNVFLQVDEGNKTTLKFSHLGLAIGFIVYCMKEGL